MSKEQFDRLQEMMLIPPDQLDEGDGVRVAELYDLVDALIKEFKLSQPTLPQ